MAKTNRLRRIDDALYRPYQKTKKLKNKTFKVRSQLFNSSTWTIDEDLLYLNFLEENKSYFEDSKERKKSIVFLKMSQFILSRSSDQCRSHHQKMFKKYKQVDLIVSGLRLKIQGRKSNNINQLETIYEKYSDLSHDSEMHFSLTEKEKTQFQVQKTSENIHQTFLDIWKCLNDDIWLNKFSQ